MIIVMIIIMIIVMFSRPEQVRLMISSDWSSYDTDYEDGGDIKARQSFSMISMMDK